MSNTQSRVTRASLKPHSAEGKPWSDEELELLRTSYAAFGPTAIARRLGRTVGAVVNRAHVIGASSRRRKWNETEDEYLRKHYASATAAEIAADLDRTELSVRNRVFTLGLTTAHGELWTDEEVAYLKKHHGHRTIAQIAEDLGRTHASVEVKSQRLKLAKRQVGRVPSPQEEQEIVALFGTVPFTQLAKRYRTPLSVILSIARRHGYRDRPTTRPWTREDEQQLRSLYGTLPRGEVARRLGRTLVATAAHAKQLGLTRKVRRTEARPWTRRDEERLRMLVGRQQVTEIARKLGRSYSSVLDKIRRLGLDARSPYTPVSKRARA
jgi:hypothetical protein